MRSTAPQFLRSLNTLTLDLLYLGIVAHLAAEFKRILRREYLVRNGLKFAVDTQFRRHVGTYVKVGRPILDRCVQQVSHRYLCRHAETFLSPFLQM